MAVAASGALLPACGVGPTDGGVASVAAPLIYGSDDRNEYFEVAAPDLRARIAESLVVLVPLASVSPKPGGVEIAGVSWRERANLCASERFSQQPAAAFCTGVLVDWDLVLTAGHCMRVLAPDQIAVVFGYYYAAPDRLAPLEVVTGSRIVSEALDPAGVEPRLDYAWLRLAHPVKLPRRPAPIHVQLLMVETGASLTTVSAGGGAPLKIDGGGTVRDPRAQASDYFLADTDTFDGSSGGGAFDAQLNLLGVLARGGTDFIATPEGCNVAAVQPNRALAEEQFTYADRAVQGLCATDPSASSLCRADCGNPCQAGPAAVASASGGGGCAVGERGDPSRGAALLGGVLIAALRSVRRRSGRADRQRSLATADSAWRPSVSSSARLRAPQRRAARIKRTRTVASLMPRV